jgi:hypothetical protein
VTGIAATSRFSRFVSIVGGNFDGVDIGELQAEPPYA